MPTTIRRMQNQAAKLLGCRSLDDLATVLKVEDLLLLTLAMEPEYRAFHIPKKDGSLRPIEDPFPKLKKIQRKLNDYFQAVYYQHRTDAAYGFLTNPVNDPSPRHILSNAQRHLGSTWLLNVDMEDFFHSIDEARVAEVFRAPLFGFNDEISRLLAGLCCFRGRLPMGAPTSPILSNIACIPLDMDLEDYADTQAWVYTRYADDLTFSGEREINEQHIREVDNWVQAYGFRLNPEKINLYGPGHPDKEVTGILVGGTAPELEDAYFDMLKGAIAHLAKVIEAKRASGRGRFFRTPWVEDLKDRIRGKIAFAAQILGDDDMEVRELEGLLLDALDPPEHYGPLSWLDFGYTLFNDK